MHYALAFFPAEGTAGIEELRSSCDPTFRLIKAHMPLVFPVPESVGKQRLVRHCERVLREVEPFPIRPGGFTKSRDHWLLLELTDRNGRLIELYNALNSDSLSDYARPDLFTPHIGLGLFLQPGNKYDWGHPSPEYDLQGYSRALREARMLDLPATWLLDRLELIEISNEVLRWATGHEPSLAPSAKAVRTHTFHLGGS